MSGICECGHEKDDHQSFTGRCDYCACFRYKNVDEPVELDVKQTLGIETDLTGKPIVFETVGHVKMAHVGNRLFIMDTQGAIAGLVTISELKRVIIGEIASCEIIRPENMVSINI